ncbi:hypothetical protein P7C71_g2120, partial [Lecanoromycetidae sp. Uapishka_2]
MADTSSVPKPSHISGGCLCGAVRYQLDFPEDSDWPPGLMRTASQLKWTSESGQFVSNANQLEKYTEYSASKGRYRGFCKVCGSTLSWREENSNGEFELLLGSVDEEYLFKGESGQRIGKVLSQFVDGHFFGSNAIKGVTDVVGEGGVVTMATNRSVSDTGAKARQTSEEPPPYAAAAPQTTEPRSSPAVLTSSDFDISYKEKGDGYQKLEGPQQLAETSVEMEGEDYVALSDAPPEYDVDFERTEVMDKGTRTTIMSHALTHDPALLIQYLQWQRQSAPDSFVRIVDHIMTRLERENWFGVFCILSQLWIVFLLLQLVLRKRWAILTIDWRAECKPRCPRKEDDEKEISRNGKVIASGNIGASTANMDANDWMNRWNIAIVRAAMNGQKGTIECSEKDELGDPLKPIRDLEEMREWGANE